MALEESSRIPWATRKMNKWVEHKSKISLEAKMKKTEAVLLQGHHEKEGFFGKKTIMLGETEAAGKEENQI